MACCAPVAQCANGCCTTCVTTTRALVLQNLVFDRQESESRPIDSVPGQHNAPVKDALMWKETDGTLIVHVPGCDCRPHWTAMWVGNKLQLRCCASARSTLSAVRVYVVTCYQTSAHVIQSPMCSVLHTKASCTSGATASFPGRKKLRIRAHVQS